MLRNLKEATAFFEETMAAHPQRDAIAAEESAWKGKPSRYLGALGIYHRMDPLDTTQAEQFMEFPATDFPKSEEGWVAERIVDVLRPLDMLNPVCRSFTLEQGGTPADMIPCFGIPKSADGGAAAHTVPLEEMLSRPAPDPETAGPMPAFKKSAKLIRDLTSPAFKINMPDFQGPYNLAHAMIGDDAFTSPLTDPEDFQKFMERITDFWIAATELLFEWIGKDRLRLPQAVPRIAECSVNMVSPDFYREHILPYDRKIARHFGQVYIHPCSGLHVFRETVENLPVAGTEAGLMIARMAAPIVSTREALKILGDRPAMLAVAQELPEDWKEAADVLKDDVELSFQNPHVLITGYTGIFWRNKDRARIRELHRELDAYWESRR